MDDSKQNFKLVLASGSPRRQQFFRDLGLDFEIRLKEIDEIYPPDLIAGEIPEYLAKLKASAFDGELRPDEMLVTSDTIVWHEGKALGKPANRADAFQMIRNLCGSTHDVITSVCFSSQDGLHLETDVSKVTFCHISDDEINYYLDHYQPYDKAGSYGIQDWIGLVAVEKIEGSYANVMGLPTHKVYQYLKTRICPH